MRNVTNYEVVIKRREKKEEKEREGQKGRMNKRARVDERVEVTRDKSGCSKSARIFSNFVAPSAAAERAAFPPFTRRFFAPLLLQSSLTFHVPRSPRRVTNGIPADHE